MNSEYLHVSQFYEAIICFSLLTLIVQKIIILCKDLNDQYLKSRANQFDDQIDWKKSFQVEKQLKQVNKQQQKIKENQVSNIQYKRQTLKTSLIDNNQSHQTDRSLIQGQQQPKRIQQQKKMQVQFTNHDQSLQQNQIQNQKPPQQKNLENNQKKSTYGDQIQDKKHVKVQNQNQIKENKTKIGVFSNQLQAQMKNQQTEKRREKSQNQQSQLAQQDVLQKQYKDKQKTRYFKRIDSLFNQYFSIIIPVLVLGILLHSTYIFTMVCFFGFIFSSLLFNYANLLNKLKSQPSENSIFAKTNKLISGLFVIALFISYWSDNQYK